MKTMSVGEFKANFSEVLKRVLGGEEIGILYGKKKEIVAKLVPKTSDKKQKRKIGRNTLRGLTGLFWVWPFYGWSHLC